MIRLPRNQLSILLLVTVVGILLATLSPFNFRFDPAFTAKRIGMIEWALLPDPEHESLFIDAAYNILFFLPFGAIFFLHRRTTATVPLSLIATSASAACFSVFAETAQIWLPTRHTQVMDALANTLGALAGGTIAATWEKIDELTSDGEIRKGLKWNAALIPFLFFLALPLCYSIHALDPVRSIKELESSAKAFIQSPLFGGWSPGNTLLPIFFLGGLSFSFAGWAMNRFPSLRVTFTYFPVFLATALYAVMLPIPRIFFRSHSPNWGSIGFGILGTALGISVHYLLRFRSPRSPSFL